MSGPTPEEVTNLFLYGNAATPANLVDDTLIRPAGGPGASLDVDLNWYMTDGPGRFALGSMHPLVERFFTDESLDQLLEIGEEYNVQGLVIALGLPQDEFYGISLRQVNYDDGEDDYAERAYILECRCF